MQDSGIIYSGGIHISGSNHYMPNANIGSTVTTVDCCPFELREHVIKRVALAGLALLVIGIVTASIPALPVVVPVFLIIGGALALISSLFKISFQNTTITGSIIPTVIGSGVETSQRVEFGDQQIASIVFRSPGKLTVTSGETCSLTTQADDNIIPLLNHRLVEGALTLDQQHNVFLQTRSPIQYHLTMPHHSVSRVTLDGEGDILLNAVAENKFSCTINGSGNVTVLGGTTKHQTITINGSGNYQAGPLRSEAVNININGDGDVTVWAAKTLSVKINGSGDCRYHGQPTLSQQIFGSGSITPVSP